MKTIWIIHKADILIEFEGVPEGKGSVGVFSNGVESLVGTISYHFIMVCFALLFNKTCWQVPLLALY